LTPLARHITSFTKLLGLGVFTFISGMLLQIQSNRPRSVGGFVWKKVKRILMPAAIVGLAYELLFPQLHFTDHPLSMIYRTHLWYLPFIFVALTLTYLLRPQWSLSGMAKIAAAELTLFVLELYQLIPGSPLLHCYIYYPIFIAGYFHKQLCNKYLAMGGVLLVPILYFQLIPISGHLAILWWFFNITLIDICISIPLAWLAMKYVRRKPGRAVMMLDRQSFHIYLVHQFVINALLLTVTFTGVALKWLPLVFAITLAGSLALCTAYDSLRTGATRLYHHFKPEL